MYKLGYTVTVIAFMFLGTKGSSVGKTIRTHEGNRKHCTTEYRNKEEALKRGLRRGMSEEDIQAAVNAYEACRKKHGYDY